MAFSNEQDAKPQFHAPAADRQAGDKQLLDRQVWDRPGADRPDRVLIVLHQERSTPGRVGMALAERGFKLDVRRPRFGDPLPTDMDDHAGAVIFGGPMSANDTDAFVKQEIDWLKVPLSEQKPFLGICLGAQMLAKHLGANVGAHPGGLVEVGYYKLNPTESGKSLLPWPDHVYHWHREGFEVPSGAELLAEGDAFPNQAIRVGPAAYGIQFHPEVTLAMVHRWTSRASAMTLASGARGIQTHFSDRFAYDAAVRAWLDAFLDLWIGSARPCVGTPVHVPATAAAEM